MFLKFTLFCFILVLKDLKVCVLTPFERIFTWLTRRLALNKISIAQSSTTGNLQHLRKGPCYFLLMLFLEIALLSWLKHPEGKSSWIQTFFIERFTIILQKFDRTQNLKQDAKITSIYQPLENNY